MVRFLTSSLVFPTDARPNLSIIIIYIFIILQDTLERLRQRFSLSIEKGVLSTKVSK